MQKIIHFLYKCGSYVLKIIHCKKDKQKDDTITSIERRKQVRDVAEQLLRQEAGMEHVIATSLLDDHSTTSHAGGDASSIEDNNIVPTSSSKTPEVFERAKSSRNILKSNPRYNANVESKNMKLASITALGLTKSSSSRSGSQQQQQRRISGHFIEDNLSVRSFSHRSTSSSIRSKRTADDGNSVEYKTKPTLLERFFAVDSHVRDGQLQKHYDNIHHIHLSQQQHHPHESTTGLVIEGAALTHLLNDTLFQEMIFAVASSCEAVVACRVSPKQKALLVKLVRTFVEDNGEEEPVTLAIGDGAK